MKAKLQAFFMPEAELKKGGRVCIQKEIGFHWLCEFRIL
jgi:hypothetical protein